jgi:hypothetical protein
MKMQKQFRVVCRYDQAFPSTRIFTVFCPEPHEGEHVAKLLNFRSRQFNGTSPWTYVTRPVSSYATATATGLGLEAINTVLKEACADMALLGTFEAKPSAEFANSKATYIELPPAMDPRQFEFQFAREVEAV